MRNFKNTFLFLLTYFLLSVTPVWANETDKLRDLEKQIQEYQRQIVELQEKASSLSGEIAAFDSRIRVTELKIEQTEEHIFLLGGRIDQLSSSLDTLTSAFSNRAVETYKLSRTQDTALLLLSSNDATDAVSRFTYLKKIQEADRNLLTRLQDAKDTYSEQKTELEDLQQVLGTQKEELDNQKSAKANLLAVTKNNENKYQELLTQARQEYEAIQAIVAGRGEETEVGEVNEGERIASIIQGPSCNSSGAHLHFIVKQNGSTQNPFNYLQSGIAHENCSGGGACSPGDSFNPSGSWQWPISPVIRYTQGYGSTWAVQNSWVGRIYSFHNGIDINSDSSSEVAAVQPGTLFQGSYSGGGGCRLRYVRLAHNDGNTETYYLHINY